MTPRRHRGTILTALGGTLVVGLVSGRAVLTPFDFTGHWSGCTGGDGMLLAGDFTGVGARKFKGSLTVQANTSEQCTVKGKRKAEQAVRLRFHCHRPCDRLPGVRRLKVRLQGKLDVGNETITGMYTSTAKGCGKRQASTGRLVMTKAGAPGPCPTPTTTTSTIPSGPCTFLLTWGVQSGKHNGELINPVGVATDASGHTEVADSNNSRSQTFDASGTFLTTWGSFGAGNGQFNNPFGVATDGSGNVYVADTFNDRVQKFDASGTFLTTWGSSGLANGQFFDPGGVATDGSGHVSVADTNNRRIQKFDTSGTFLTTWGSYGSGNGQFFYPFGVATDGSGNVYVADSSNTRIQNFALTSTFLTTWGSYGSDSGQFTKPAGVATDGSGHVYVADT